jgi:TP901 family phage tail tape measure protein
VAKSTPINVSITGDYNDKDIKRAMADLQRLQASSQTFASKMSAVGTNMQAFGRSVSRVGGALTKSVTLPIVGIGVAATAMAVEFDNSMTKIVSLVGLTRDEVDGMRGDVIKMASQYGKSASEAADALFFITSAGLRGRDAMQTLESSLKGAAVGLGDVKTIADLATSAMNAYGPQTLSAGKATDILAGAVREGKLESSELAGAMGQVLPVASAMGVGFDEVGAAMAAMSRTGTNAATASTQLRGILNSLLKPSQQAEKALAGMGLSSEGLRQQLREQGLLATLQTLSDKFDGNDAAAAKVFGNVRALSGVLDLMGANAATTEQIFGSLTNATGILDDGFATVAETTGFKLQQAFQTTKNSLIEIGDIIAPVVAQVAQRISELVKSFQALSPETKQFIVIAAAIAAAVGPVLLVVGKLITMIGGAIKVFALITAAGSILAIKIIAVIAAVVAIAAAFKFMWDSSEALRNAVGGLIATLQNIAKTLIGDVGKAFSNVTGQAGGFGSVLRTVGEFMGNVLSHVVKTLTGAFTVLGNILRVVIKVFEGIYTVLFMVANLIRGGIMLAIDVLMNRLGPVSAAFRNMANGIRTAFSTVASFVSSAFNNVGKAVETFINFGIKAVNTLISAYNKLADFLPGVSRASLIAEFRFSNMSAATDAAASSANNLANQIGGYASQVMRGNKAVEAGIVPAQQQASALDTLVNSYTGAASGAGKAGSAAKKSGEDAKDAAKKYTEAFQDIRGKLTEAVEDIKKKMADMATSVSSSLMRGFKLGDAAEEFDKEGERVGGSFIEKLQEQANRVTGFAEKVKELMSLGLGHQQPIDEGRN